MLGQVPTPCRMRTVEMLPERLLGENESSPKWLPRLGILRIDLHVRWKVKADQRKCPDSWRPPVSSHAFVGEVLRDSTSPSFVAFAQRHNCLRLQGLRQIIRQSSHQIWGQDTWLSWALECPRHLGYLHNAATQSSVITTSLGYSWALLAARQQNCQNRTLNSRTSPPTTIANMGESNYMKSPTFTNIFQVLSVLNGSYRCPYQHLPTISSALKAHQDSPGSCLVVVEQLPREGQALVHLRTSTGTAELFQDVPRDPTAAYLSYFQSTSLRYLFHIILHVCLCLYTYNQIILQNALTIILYIGI